MSHAVPRNGIFLSYSRADGEAFARQLSRRLELEAPELGPIWQDRSRMQGGIGWWTQITDAIDRSGFLVLIASEGAMRSPIVQKEWRYARQHGVCVCPVLTTTALDFKELPRWMAKVHFHNLDAEWETFLQYLRGGCEAPRVPFLCPDLPTHFVERIDELERLKQLLLRGDLKDPVALTASLRAGGGFGKTTLAAALCHDSDIQTAFDDGILWVTLGEKPNLLEKTSGLYGALTGERNPIFLDVEEACRALVDVLSDRSYFLVIDDVWRADDLAPFLRGGINCARLITTRIADIAPEAHRLDLSEMSSAEAEKVFTNVGLRNGMEAELARRLGNWPIALSLARSNLLIKVNRGQTLDTAVQQLLHALEKRGTSALESEGGGRHRTITATMQLSMDLLSDLEKERFVSLAIFPEDTEIPLAVVGAFWKLDEFETGELVERFENLSLLKILTPKHAIQIHDLIRNWIARKIQQPAAIHASLLNVWDDPYGLSTSYAWRWYAYHLTHSGRIADLRKLLLEYRWLECKLLATDVNALLSDFDYIQHDRDTDLLQRAIRNSAHTLRERKSQLGAQLIARLSDTRSDAICNLLSAVVASKRSCWLRPRSNCLHRPDGPLLRTLRHPTLIRAVAISADGNRAISGGDTKGLRLWDLQTGVELMVRACPHISRLAMSADGRWAISDGGYDTSRWAVHVWNLDTGSETALLHGHDSDVFALAMSSDGAVAVSAPSAFEDHTVSVWDLAKGKRRAVLEGHASRVSAIAISGDGRWILSGEGTGDHALSVWDAKSETRFAVLYGHSDWVESVAISSDGRRAASIGRNGILIAWNLETRERIATVNDPQLGSHLTMSADGRYILSDTRSQTLILWDLATGERTKTIDARSGHVTAVAMSADATRAISASIDGVLQVWDLEKATEEAVTKGHTAAVNSISISADATRAISASQDGSLKLWDVASMTEAATLRGHGGPVQSVALSANGLRAISGGYPAVKIWDISTETEIWTLEACEKPIALNRDGSRAICGCEMLVLLDVNARRALFEMVGHSNSVSAVVMSVDGQRAISVAEDETIKIWDLTTGTLLANLSNVPGLLRCAAASPDFRLILRADADYNYNIWDLDTNTRLATLQDVSLHVNAAVITPDGCRLVAAAGHTIKIWNTNSGALIADFYADTTINTCAVAGDGKTIVAGDDGGRVMFFYLQEEAAG